MFWEKFDAELQVSNIAGSDTLLKPDYIHVHDFPTADFIADDTVINIGETVNFSDLSYGNIQSWNWTFESGTPNGSLQSQPPSILYSNSGCFEVRLLVSNILGEDSLVRTCYIEVQPDPVLSDFIGDNLQVSIGGQVNYTDLSSNAPTSWSWGFEGATTNYSLSQHPSGVTYDSVGCFYVELHAANSSGGDTMTKICYIEVMDPEGMENLSSAEFRMFPNPSMGSIRVSIPFGQFRPLKIYSMQGELLHYQRISNNDLVPLLSLSSGLYIVEVESSRKILVYQKD